jgi:hypothetical protein
MVGWATRLSASGLWPWDFIFRNPEDRGHSPFKVFPCFPALDVFVFPFHHLQLNTKCHTCAMTDKKHGDDPSGKPDTQPSPQRPVPMPPQQSQMGEASNGDSTAKQGVASELSREFKWVEIAQIASNVVLAIVGIIALCIYNGQLSVMKGQLKQMQSSGQQTDQTIVLLRQQATDTHALAEAAKAQADQAKAQTDKMAESLSKSDELIREASAQAKAAQDSVKLATEESARSGIRTEKQLNILQDQVVASRDQANAALNSALAIQKQTEISERPWISVEATAERLIFVNGRQAALVLKLSIKNVGKSVAKNVQADAKMFAAPPGLPIAVESPTKQRELCDHPKLSQMFSTDLFPSGHPVERELDISVLPSDIAAQSSSTADKSHSFVGFYVVGCLTYLFSFDNKVGQTRFAYHVIGPAGFTSGGQPVNLPNGTIPMMSFEVGVDVPKDKISLMQEALASNDAR